MKYYTFLEIINNQLHARYDKIQIIFDFDYQITNDSKIIIKNREYEILAFGVDHGGYHSISPPPTLQKIPDSSKYDINSSSRSLGGGSMSTSS